MVLARPNLSLWHRTPRAYWAAWCLGSGCRGHPISVSNGFSFLLQQTPASSRRGPQEMPGAQPCSNFTSLQARCWSRAEACRLPLTLPCCCDRAAAVPPWGRLNLPQRKSQELAPEPPEPHACLQAVFREGCFAGESCVTSFFLKQRAGAAEVGFVADVRAGPEAVSLLHESCE